MLEICEICFFTWQRHQFAICSLKFNGMMPAKTPTQTWFFHRITQRFEDFWYTLSWRVQRQCAVIMIFLNSYPIFKQNLTQVTSWKLLSWQWHLLPWQCLKIHDQLVTIMTIMCKLWLILKTKKKIEKFILM